MRSLFTALILVGSSLALTGCDNGNNDSTSGGGSSLNLSGTWYVIPNVRPKNNHISKPYFASLNQSGGNVVESSNILYDPETSTNSCDKTGFAMVHKMNGTTSGNTFSGTLTATFADGTPYSSANFAVSGTSNALAGSYRVTYNSGACLGARTGTVSMKRN